MQLKDINILECLLPGQHNGTIARQQPGGKAFEAIYEQKTKEPEGSNASNRPAQTEQRAQPNPVRATFERDPSELTVGERSRPAVWKRDEQAAIKADEESAIKRETVGQATPEPKAFPNAQGKKVGQAIEAVDTGMTEEVQVPAEDLETVTESKDTIDGPVEALLAAMMQSITELNEELAKIEDGAPEAMENTKVAALVTQLKDGIADLVAAVGALKSGESVEDAPALKLVKTIEAMQTFNDTLKAVFKEINALREQADLPEELLPVLDKIKALAEDAKPLAKNPLANMNAEPILERMREGNLQTEQRVLKQIDKLIERLQPVEAKETSTSKIENSEPNDNGNVVPKAEGITKEVPNSKVQQVVQSEQSQSKNNDSKNVVSGERSIHLEQVTNPIDRQVGRIQDKVQNNQSLFKSILNQVQDGVTASLKVLKDSSEMLIKLKPESLGEVSVKITVHKNTVLAEMTVQSQIVKEALESSLNDLKNTLKDKGFVVDQLQVNVGDGRSEKHANQSQNGQSRGRHLALGRIEDPLEIPIEELAKTYVHNGKIDYFA